MKERGKESALFSLFSALRRCHAHPRCFPSSAHSAAATRTPPPLRYGLPDESCLTYTATDHTKFSTGLDHCPAGGFCVNCMPVHEKDVCWAVKTPILYHVTAFGRVGARASDENGVPLAQTLGGVRANARAMQSEILARGPIVCSVATPDDFVYKYRGGVYDDHNSTTLDDVDHDVEVVGWGVDEDTGADFWLVRNSWGTFWGELGFFRLARGTNALWIENGGTQGARGGRGGAAGVGPGRHA